MITHKCGDLESGFMEFNRKATARSKKLPAQHVTPAWLRALCMAIQKKTSNYDTDVFAVD